MKIFILAFLSLYLTSVICDRTASGQYKEYCSLQTFNPACSRDEVIQIKHAVYGRMKLGQCVKSDYGLGTLGCSLDVQSYFDSKCSGRRSCELYVPIAELGVKIPCIQEMSPYLEASYVCQKEYCSLETFSPTCKEDEVIQIKHGMYGRMRIGRCVKDDYGMETIGCDIDMKSFLDSKCSVYLPAQPRCTAPLTISATSRSQYLSSVITKESSCGLHQTPYIVEAKLGQHVSITLVDFSMKSDAEEKRCVTSYGYILDTGNDDVISLCGGSSKTGVTYTSVKHQVQILLEHGSLQNYHFIIKFEATGCPDVTPPNHGWMKKENNTVVMGCLSSPHKWSLRCVGNVWLGIVKNCTAPIAVTQPVVVMKNNNIEIDEIKTSGIPHVSDNHLMAIGIGCVTIIICCVTVVLGIHCVKRYELNVAKKSTYNMNTLNHNINTLYKAVPNGDTLMFSTHTGEHPTYTLNQDGVVPQVPQRNASVTGGAVNMGHNNRDSDIYHSIHRHGSLLG